MLFLARYRNLPVVLHCRDNGTGQAASKTLQVIKETGLTDLKYHRHCFTGTYEELWSGGRFHISVLESLGRQLLIEPLLIV
jgi:Tat protein secretion system quality control protein TatD with DNase activity